MSEWLGKRYKKGSGPSDVVMWLELPSQFLLGATLSDPHQPVSFAETLEAAMRSNPDRKPDRIRVPNQTLAREARSVAGDGIEVIAGRVPELDAAHADFMQGLDEFVEVKGPSYFSHESIAEPDLGKLFAAAAALYRLRPWTKVREHQIVRIDIPTLGVHEGVMSIIGERGESLGMLFFFSLADFESFGEPAQDPNGTPQLRPFISLSFGSKTSVPPSMAREIEEHRWKLTGPSAYPAIITHDGSAPHAPQKRDVQLMTVCALVFSTVFQEAGETFNSEEPMLFNGSYDVGGMTATVYAPFVDDEFLQSPTGD